VDRAALLLDAYALAKANYAPVESVVELLKSYVNEDNSTVWSAISGVLNGLNYLMEQVGGETFTAFKKFAKSIVMNALAAVGWTSGAEEGHTDKLKRVTVLGLVETFCYDEAAVLSEARRRFDTHWQNPEELPSDFKAIVYRIILREGKTEDYEQILASFYATEDNTEKKHVMVSLGATSQSALQIRTLDWAVKGQDVKLQDFFYPIQSVAAASESGSNAAWAYVKANIEVIKSKLAKASPSLMDAVIIMALCRHCTLEQAAEVREFFSQNPIPSSERKIGQTVEAMTNTGAMLERIKASPLASPETWA